MSEIKDVNYQFEETLSLWNKENNFTLYNYFLKFLFNIRNMTYIYHELHNTIKL